MSGSDGGSVAHHAAQQQNKPGTRTRKTGIKPTWSAEREADPYASTMSDVVAPHWGPITKGMGVEGPGP